MNLPYRKCVVAVIQDERGLLLVGERKGQRGAWQFPQGGVDDNEDYYMALLRELKEEIGNNKVELVKDGNMEISYDFPGDLNAQIARRYRGQSQRWFLVRFIQGEMPDLSESDGEFQDLKWVSVRDVLENIISWKLDAYKKGLVSLGIL
ncbi:MAG: RNA pyrophosphohydrolase [Oligoflexales bacterium]|nr:RNA pyrophosphohydrolase [Oligoflexales bacterium]